MNQNMVEHLSDMIELKNMTADEANVALVRAERVRVVNGHLPAAVRKALNQAVKTGTLGRKPKQGLKPEVYFHPTFEYLANEARARIERESTTNIAAVL